MCRWTERGRAGARLLAALLLASPAVAAPPADGDAASPRPWSGIGRPALPQEIAAWDIDVRGDLAGLPKGRGSVSDGERLWEAKCARCHGSFGEANEVAPPLVGGTTREDLASGRVRALAADASPGERTTLMKLARVSTLWDYIRRAMPWDAPGTLAVDEVYAVVAYLLHLGDVVPAEFVLSEANIASVRLPNRDGMTFYAPLWDAKARASDTANRACMSGCAAGPARITSRLPPAARDAQGDLSRQMRELGFVRGVPGNAP